MREKLHLCYKVSRSQQQLKQSLPKMDGCVELKADLSEVAGLDALGARPSRVDGRFDGCLGLY